MYRREAPPPPMSRNWPPTIQQDPYAVDQGGWPEDEFSDDEFGEEYLTILPNQEAVDDDIYMNDGQGDDPEPAAPRSTWSASSGTPHPSMTPPSVPPRTICSSTPTLIPAAMGSPSLPRRGALPSLPPTPRTPVNRPPNAGRRSPVPPYPSHGPSPQAKNVVNRALPQPPPPNRRLADVARNFTRDHPTSAAHRPLPPRPGPVGRAQVPAPPFESEDCYLDMSRNTSRPTSQDLSDDDDGEDYEDPNDFMDSDEDDSGDDYVVPNAIESPPRVDRKVLPGPPMKPPPVPCLPPPESPVTPTVKPPFFSHTNSGGGPNRRGGHSRPVPAPPGQVKPSLPEPPPGVIGGADLVAKLAAAFAKSETPTGTHPPATPPRPLPAAPSSGHRREVPPPPAPADWPPAPHLQSRHQLPDRPDSPSQRTEAPCGTRSVSQPPSIPAAPSHSNHTEPAKEVQPKNPIQELIAARKMAKMNQESPARSRSPSPRPIVNLKKVTPPDTKNEEQPRSWMQELSDRNNRKQKEQEAPNRPAKRVPPPLQLPPRMQESSSVQSQSRPESPDLPQPPPEMTEQPPPRDTSSVPQLPKRSSFGAHDHKAHGNSSAHPLPPSSPLASPNDLEALYSYSWYFGDISRQEVDSSLKSVGQTGTFLVRKSLGSYGNPYTLQFIDQGQIWRLPIRRRDTDKQYALGHMKDDEEGFDNVASLISFYQKNPVSVFSSHHARTATTILTKSPPKS